MTLNQNPYVESQWDYYLTACWTICEQQDFRSPEEVLTFLNHVDIQVSNKPDTPKPHIKVGMTIEKD